MNLPPHIAAALALERQRRRYGYLAATHGLLGSPTVHFTPRIRLELEIAGNAFLCGHVPSPADVFGLLWRIHPHFTRPDGSQPNVRGSLSPHTNWSATRASVHSLVSAIDLGVAEAAVRAYLAAIYQDYQPAMTDEKASPLPKPAPLWLDDLVDYFAARYGWSLDQILDTPMSLLFQWHRSALIAAGATVIDPTRELIAEYAGRLISSRARTAVPSNN